MSVEIQKSIETAVKSVVSTSIATAADPDFSALQIFAFHVDEGDRTLPNVAIIATDELDEYAPGRGFWSIPLNVSSGTHLPSDENRAILSKLDAVVFASLTESAIGLALDEPLALLGMEFTAGQTTVGDGEGTENTQSKVHQFTLNVVDTTFLTTTTT